MRLSSCKVKIPRVFIKFETASNGTEQSKPGNLNQNIKQYASSQLDLKVDVSRAFTTERTWKLEHTSVKMEPEHCGLPPSEANTTHATDLSAMKMDLDCCAWTEQGDKNMDYHDGHANDTDKHHLSVGTLIIDHNSPQVIVIKPEINVTDSHLNPTVIEHVLPVTEHVPSVNEQVLTVNEHVLPVNEHVLSVNEQVLTVNENVPSVNEHVPSVNEQDLTVNEHVLSVNEHVPSVNEQGLTVNEHVPSVNEHDPSVNEQVLTVNEHVPPVNEHVTSVNEQVLTVNEHGPPVNEHVLSVNEHVPPVNEHVPPVNEHVLSINQEKKISCPVCDKKFDTRRLLARHIPEHAQKVHFICEVCRRGFECSSDLKAHRFFHTNFKFKCGKCGKRFKQKQYHLKHEEVCGNIYNCLQCGREYVSKHALCRHRSKCKTSK